MRGWLVVLASAAWLALVSGPETLERGLAAYRAGRFEEAFQALREAEEEAGDEASAELLLDQALAALEAGHPIAAAVAAEKAAARGGARFFPLRDFVLGHVEYQQCLAARKRARGPEAGLPMFDEALMRARAALRFWRSALLAAGEDWPAARRNAERAWLAAREIEKEREKALERRKRRERKGRRKPSSAGVRRRTEKAADKRPAGELSPAQVRRLLERMRAKEREKARSRRMLLERSRAEGGDR